MQRLGKNQGAYCGETIDIREVLTRASAAARQRGWSEDVFHTTQNLPFFAFTRPISFNGKRRLYISAGIHGDEPAGPLAALELIQADDWPADAEVVLLPCLNPEAFTQNRRENAAGVDLNRDFRDTRSAEIKAHLRWLIPQAPFDLCLCLHEDWESHGFYLYELNPDSKPSLAKKMIAQVTPVCPIDLSPVIENRAAHGGIIQPSIDPRSRPLWPESFWLLQNKTRLSYTLEAPSDFALSVRVNALVAAVRAAILGSEPG